MRTTLAIFRRCAAVATGKHCRQAIAGFLCALGMVYPVYDAPVACAQTVDGHIGAAPLDYIQVVLRNGLTVTGEVIRTNDSTLVLSSVNPPIELLVSQSRPLTVDLSVVVIRLADGNSVTGQVVGLTDRSLTFRKLGGLTTETMERWNVVAVSPVGLTPNASEVLLWWADVASIQKVEPARRRGIFWSLAPRYVVVGNRGAGGQLAVTAGSFSSIRLGLEFAYQLRSQSHTRDLLATPAGQLPQFTPYTYKTTAHRMWQATVVVRTHNPRGGVYLVGGGGLYGRSHSRSSKIRYPAFTELRRVYTVIQDSAPVRTSSTAFGLNAGIGIESRTSDRIALGIEARTHVIGFRMVRPSLVLVIQTGVAFR